MKKRSGSSWVGERIITRAEFLAKPGMREDRNKADYANSLNANIGLAVNYFLDSDGNIDDVYEILASHISERAFLKIAKNRYGMLDPLE